MQIVYLYVVLRDSPLKLGAPEIEYVAASPVSRGIVIAVHFVLALLLPVLLIAVAGCLLAMLLTWSSAPGVVGFAGLQALVLGVPLGLFSAALAWIVATVKACSLRARSSSRSGWRCPPRFCWRSPSLR